MSKDYNNWLRSVQPKEYKLSCYIHTSAISSNKNILEWYRYMVGRIIENTYRDLRINLLSTQKYYFNEIIKSDDKVLFIVYLNTDNIPALYAIVDYLRRGFKNSDVQVYDIRNKK